MLVQLALSNKLFYFSSIIPPTQWEERPDSDSSHSESPTRPLTPQPRIRQTEPTDQVKPDSNNPEKKKENQEEKDSFSSQSKPLSLEEENRQLKEARLCKVCMDSEASFILYNIFCKSKLILILGNDLKLDISYTKTALI